jgi:CxxC-x17-CxxC domain-containing protein
VLGLCLEKKEQAIQMTLIVDDAGSGDLLFGVVIGAYREETGEFKYDLIDVRFYQELFCKKEYLQEASRVTAELLAKLKVKPDEEIHVCQGNIFDVAVADLQKVHGEDLVTRVRVTGEAQRLVEIAYLDEIRNLGYEPLEEREAKRAKSFFHMMRWLKANPSMLRYAKTGWPRLKRYRLFKDAQEDEELHEAVCSECGSPCEVPFKPDPHRPVFCPRCWKKRKGGKKRNAGK